MSHKRPALLGQPRRLCALSHTTQPCLHQHPCANERACVQIKLPFPCSNEDYEQRMAGAIAAAKAAGIDAIAYGDLCLADVSQA